MGVLPLAAENVAREALSRPRPERFLLTKSGNTPSQPFPVEGKGSEDWGISVQISAALSN